MRLGVISDAHGNDEGLGLCLKYLRDKKCDKLIFLGDAVGYFSRGAECCRMLEQAGAVCLMGNHEAMVRGDLPVPNEKEDILRLPPSWSSLPEKWRKQVEANGPRLELALSGRRILCVHGSPDKPLTEYLRREVAARIYFDTDILLLGHTHVPFVETAGHGVAINPGSCGLPRDKGDMLSCAVLDLDPLEADVVRLPFTPSKDLLASAHEKVRECMARKTPACFGRILE